MTLWAAGVAVASPARDRRAVNKNQVIETVIDELQPEIARAVAEALRLLQAANIGSVATSSTTSTGFDFHDSLDKYEKPVYNFELKVSDDVEQTYIAHNEERDGTELTGSYSYVDANGALVTVNYKAGVGGYEETREVQEGVVQIRAKTNSELEATEAARAAAAEAARIKAAAEAARIQAAAEAARIQAAAEAARIQAAAEAARIKAAREAAAEAARIQAAAAAAEAARIAAEQEAARLAAEAAQREQLIAQIIAAVTPQITGAVKNAIDGQSVSVTTVNEGRSSLNQFANFGQNAVHIETPTFKIDY